MQIVQHKKSMHRYALLANYLQWKENDQIKRLAVYIDGRKKAIGNIANFIKSTCPVSTNKRPNCIFEAREGNHIFCMYDKINKFRGRFANRLQFESLRYKKKVTIMGLERTIM